MPKYMAVHVAVLAGLVLAVTFLVFQSRALTFRVQALEAKRPADKEASPEIHDVSRKPYIPFEGSKAEVSPDFPVESGKLESRDGPEKKPEATPVEPAALTPGQEEAVAKSVDRILKEKYGHLAKVPNPEDLEKTLEKELGLSESQKVRIGEILKWKRGEASRVFSAEEGILSGKTLKKAMELEAKSEELIKAELSATQQAKYDQLKKDGRIPQSLMIQIEADDAPAKD